MIITLTPNPSVDRTISVDSVTVGAVHRAMTSREDPGGKGINVSRALSLHDVPTLAVLPVGGAYGDLMLHLLERADLPHRAVPIAGATRANVALVEPDGTTTKINELGPVLTPAETDALVAAAQAGAAGDWLVVCGSLPQGLAADFYSSLIHRARALGLTVAVDTSGAALTDALTAAPDLIKPNRVELAEAVGRELTSLGDVIDAARDLIATGIREVLVSLGRDGAVLVTAESVDLAACSVESTVSTVGAGDSLLAGYLTDRSRGAAPADALALGVRFGAAAVQLPGSQVPGPDDIARLQATPHPVDPALPLDD